MRCCLRHYSYILSLLLLFHQSLICSSCYEQIGIISSPLNWFLACIFIFGCPGWLYRVQFSVFSMQYLTLTILMYNGRDLDTKWHDLSQFFVYFVATVSILYHLISKRGTIPDAIMKFHLELVTNVKESCTLFHWSSDLSILLCNW